MWPKINEKLHRIFSISPLPIFARMANKIIHTFCKKFHFDFLLSLKIFYIIASIRKNHNIKKSLTAIPHLLLPILYCLFYFYGIIN